MITPLLTGHSFKYRRLLAGGEDVEDVEDVQTDKHIPYEQNELQQTLEKYDSKELSYKKKIDKLTREKHFVYITDVFYFHFDRA
ncbi:hypothetical protein ACU80K_27785 (plasmid) [Bacillus mycoides]|uniref:Uncharacterized protein n=1 Tax=Bacillus cereus MC67 TaxID=1053219 RepID=J8ENY1_BACCE|nr:hypothetical protein [Bacillus cereus]EJQ92917.1 hypothetical protein II3_05371 [Bacillus cereus MC67]